MLQLIRGGESGHPLQDYLEQPSNVPKYVLELEGLSIFY